jgi:Protein of unknown function (DUF1553)/Protein of unknown function (DUF1549)
MTFALWMTTLIKAVFFRERLAVILFIRLALIAAGLVVFAAACGEGEEHWAFRPLTRPQLPAKTAAGGSTSPVDRFVEIELAKRQLSLSPAADRATLVRRLSLDLLGLPPRPDEVAAFLADSAPDAYERLVERLLASPHYGERWGKYWLDAAGYADSNGYFNADTDRLLAYRYRDYVIRALNRDLPFDQFVREQLAGDELAGFVPGGEASPQIAELLEATHFLRNGQDGSGESDGNPDEVRVDRYTALESAMQNTFSSLMALTVQCAKCHDHKFEPLTQQDYYRFQAILYPVFDLERWVKPNDRFVLAPLPGQRELWEQQKRQLDEEFTRLQTEFTAWAREYRPRDEVLFEDTFDSTADTLAETWSNTAPGDDGPGGDVPVNVDSATAPGAVVVEGHLRIVESGGAGSRWLSTRQKFDWTPDEKGQAIQVTFDLVDNKLSAADKPAERIGYYLALHDFNDNSPLAGGNILIDGNPGGSTTVHVDYPGTDAKSAGDIGVTGYAPGRNYGVRVTNVGDGKFRLEHLVEGLPEEKSITLAAADLPDGGFGWEFCCGRSFILDNVRIERFAAASGQANSTQAPEFTAELKRRREPLEQARKTRDSHAKNPPGKIAWITDVTPEAPDVFLLERGNYAARTAKVDPGPPAMLRDEISPFAIAPPASGAKTTGRRLALANWLTGPNSRPAALLARVQVNRLWQHHFGTGIVATPENLGASGAAPSHPELLEWLATEFSESDWSFKTMHRQIVGSDTYRQTSRASDAALRADPEARWLSRFPIRRLDAEAIRDSLLAASGELDERLFGPYVPTSRNSAGEVVVAENDAGARRRSIYLQARRTQVASLLAVFDAPSIVFNCTARPRSTMPLQSLSLLNSEFVVARAQHLAERLAEEPTRGAGTPADERQRLAAAFACTLGRPPTETELVAARNFLQTQRRVYEQETREEQRAWRDLCQMLLASNAFLYLE